MPENPAGSELNRTGLPGRFIIDTPAEDLVGAARWPGALSHVREQVLPVERNGLSANASATTRRGLVTPTRV